MAYRITGGSPIGGKIRVSGSKNAVLPILFACLLIKEDVTLLGVPHIGDVYTTLLLLRSMGASVLWDGERLTVNCREVCLPHPDAPEICALRASSYLLGAGLSRFGEMRMAPPGGCNFGIRPLNLHKDAFLSLGALWEDAGGEITVQAKEMRGADIVLPYPSVGATVNAVLAALGAKGESRIHGYAGEPHVRCFLRFLRASGALLHVGANTVTVCGKVPLHGTCFTVCPDDVEAATFLIGGALLRARLTVDGVDTAALFPLFRLFDSMGIAYRKGEGSVTVMPTENIRRARIVCAPYPAFPTDLQPLACVLLSATQWGGRLIDRVWSGRFAYVKELQKMGLRVKKDGNSLTVLPSTFHGASLFATDLRGGAAMVLAALSAEGESRIDNTALIERGYADFLQKWKTLGALAERIRD